MILQSIYRHIVLCILFGISVCVNAQEPEYKPYQELEEKPMERYSEFDSLPLLVDSFFREFRQKDVNKLTKFIPDMAYVKVLFDSMEVDYTAQKLAYRQQMYLRRAQVRYSKLHKKIKKIKFDTEKCVLEKYDYDCGEADKNRIFCYVSMTCKEKKKSIKVRFLVVLLNDLWFVGDEFYLE
jgi:hypothetical protein